MRCEDYRDRLTARLDGELSEHDTRDHDAHADTCAVCRALRDERRTEQERWRTAWRETAPADLRHELLTATPAAPHRSVPSWLPWAAAAAVLAVLVLPRLRPDPPAQAAPFSAPCNLIVEEAVGTERTLVLSGRLL